MVPEERVSQRQRGLLFLAAGIQPGVSVRRLKVPFAVSVDDWDADEETGRCGLCRFRGCGGTETCDGSGWDETWGDTESIQSADAHRDGVSCVVIESAILTPNLNLRAQILGMVACQRLRAAAFAKSRRRTRPPSSNYHGPAQTTSHIYQAFCDILRRERKGENDAKATRPSHLLENLPPNPHGRSTHNFEFRFLPDLPIPDRDAHSVPDGLRLLLYVHSSLGRGHACEAGGVHEWGGTLGGGRR